MADNRIARGIVLVPCLLLGGAFLATAAWGQGAAAENRTLAIGIGAGLLLAGSGCFPPIPCRSLSGDVGLGCRGVLLQPRSSAASRSWPVASAAQGWLCCCRWGTAAELTKPDESDPSP